jgi:hypoxanthine phosphoribosyltransferase
VETFADDIEHVLIKEDEIEAKLAEMGEQITRDYAGRQLLLVGVLKGAFVVMADLSRHIRLPLEFDFMVDSGLTLKYLLKNLAGRKPATLEVAALLRKEGIQQVDLDLRYIGFDIPNEFVVGYGLDFAERYRNLPYIGTLKPSAYGA